MPAAPSASSSRHKPAKAVLWLPCNRGSTPTFSRPPQAGFPPPPRALAPGTMQPGAGTRHSGCGASTASCSSSSPRRWFPSGLLLGSGAGAQRIHAARCLAKPRGDKTVSRTMRGEMTQLPAGCGRGAAAPRPPCSPFAPALLVPRLHPTFTAFGVPWASLQPQCCPVPQLSGVGAVLSPRGVCSSGDILWGARPVSVCAGGTS